LVVLRSPLFFCRNAAVAEDRLVEALASCVGWAVWDDVIVVNLWS